MDSRYRKIVDLLCRNETRLIVLCSTVVAVLLCGYVVVKYATYSYNALDFGIFSQVIHGLAQGRWYGFTIHPHSYLGDHFDLFLIVFAPLVTLIRTPLVLLFVQVLALILGVYPLTKLARRYLPPPWSLLVVICFLASPTIHNVAIFEFHELAFAVPLLLSALVLYERRRFWPYMALLLVTMTIREDLGMILVGLGLLAWVDRRPRIWRILPVTLGLLWFVGGTVATGYFNGEHYKFLAYYRWLGATPLEMARNAATKPWMIILKILRLQNLAFLTVLFLQFALVPLLALRRLLPVLFVLAALLLTGLGADAVTIYTHYPALVLPFLFWALIYGIRRFLAHPMPRLASYVDRPRAAFAVFILIVLSYGLFTFSPLRPSGVVALERARNNPQTILYQALLPNVPKDAHIAASFASLPFFSDHEYLYSIHYGFRGRRQLSETPYELPKDTDWILYDARDFLFYTVQYQHDASIFAGGPGRLRGVLDRGFGIEGLFDSVAVFQRGLKDVTPLYTIGSTVGEPYSDEPTRPVQLIASTIIGGVLRPETNVVNSRRLSTLPITLTWRANVPLDTSYHLLLSYVDRSGNVRFTTRFPIGYGLLPTTEWPVGAPISFRYNWLVPKLPQGDYTLRISIASMRGYATLDQKLSAAIQTTSESVLGEPIDLATLSIQ